MKIFAAVCSLAFTLGLVWVLETPFGPIPPVGRFLNPSTGFWQNAESKNILTEQDLQLDGLIDKVTILYDDNRIPHIFAKNNHDLYYAQGYVTASDRLGQMDIQTRSASGRLAEVVGEKALETDRYHRRIGMVYGAENTLAMMMKDPDTKRSIEAYTEGVNSYIHQLTPARYPIEFKLLNYKPEDWKPINCAFLMKLMAETLSGSSDDMEMTNTLQKFGAAVTNDLFPDEDFFKEPIIPAGTKWNFKALPVPKPSATYAAQMVNHNKPKGKVEGIGSNNWAVSGSKSATGYPLLANDPHLNLTFPSIWYQIQLNAPGVNVNGASLPGGPNVIVGYNEKISWGVTNTDADVFDWYSIRFKDTSRNEYWYNNHWNKTTRRTEVINIRGQKPLTEQVIYTHFGPVVYETDGQKTKDSRSDVPVGTALRWIAQDGSNDIRTFYMLNRGKNYDDYRKALTYFTAPAQNFVFASSEDIAITPNGKLPLKYKEQGKYVMDGTDPGNDWQGWIPADQNPTVKNPSRGFVSSANQALTDSSYPYYNNWQFAPYGRGKRINDKLSAMTHITADSLRLLQMDCYSITAQNVLPLLLKYIDASKLDGTQIQALNLLKNWNKRYDATNEAPVIFNGWWNEAYTLIWDEFDTPEGHLAWPSRDRTIQLLLKTPDSNWFDIAGTPVREKCGDIVNLAFYTAVDKLLKKYGQPGKNWQWGEARPVEIGHLANLDGFGSGKFASGGTGGVINALGNGNGPSWRMVVQMGPQVKGYGVFPGGESGNPGSFYYTDMLQTWKDGKLNELLFLKSATERSTRIKTTLTLNKK